MENIMNNVDNRRVILSPRNIVRSDRVVHRHIIKTERRSYIKPLRNLGSFATKISRTSKNLVSNVQKNDKKSMLALLVAAHNEELVLEKTLRSAIAAGMKPENIYIVDDNSTDATSDIARLIVPPTNVFRVGRSGKGLALTKARNHFDLCNKYRWIHVADADGAFAPNYFNVFEKFES